MITPVDTNLFRGPRPDDFNDLTALGIKSVINLELGWFEFFHGLWEKEQDELHRLKIDYVHTPIDDLCFPDRAKLDNILKDIEDARSVGPVFVHCMHGKTRTGIVCASYRVKVQGWPVNKAIQEMLDSGFEVIPYKYLGWIGFLREYLFK